MILDGDITNIATQNKFIQDILQSLRKVPHITDIDMHMSDEDFITGMRKRSRGKSFSASGQYYSLYKALQFFLFTMNLITKLIITSANNRFLLVKWKK